MELDDQFTIHSFFGNLSLNFKLGFTSLSHADFFFFFPKILFKKSILGLFCRDCNLGYTFFSGNKQTKKKSLTFQKENTNYSDSQNVKDSSQKY